MWSTGVILYILLCGFRPFTRRSCPRSLSRSCTPGEPPPRPAAPPTSPPAPAPPAPPPPRGRHVPAPTPAPAPPVPTQVRLPSPWWDNISKEAKSLVQRLLTIDPTKRITAAEVKVLPWITGASDVALEGAQKNLKKYNATRKLKKAALGLMAKQRMVRRAAAAAARAALRLCTPRAPLARPCPQPALTPPPPQAKLIEAGRQAQ